MGVISYKTMRILFIAPYIPSLVRVRPFNFIRTMYARGHEVTLLALVPPSDSDSSLDELKDWCQAVHTVPHSRNQVLMNGARGLLSSLPLQAYYSYSPAFVDKLQQVLTESSFDVAHVEHLRGAILADSLKSLPIVFDSVDSISLLFGKLLEDAPNLKSRFMAKLDLERTRHFEGTLTSRYSQVAVTSEADRQALIKLGSRADCIQVVSNGVDLDYFKPQSVPREPLRLVFTGKMSYHANVAAVEDLVHKIMPLVWQAQPQAELYIVGKDPTEAVKAFAQTPKVVVTGSVPDMRPYLASAAVALSTVRYGVGVQNKVLEAMAMATPVVCSPQANSALQTRVGEDILVGNSPEAISSHILDLLGSPEKRNRIGAAGRKYVETYQTWDRSVSILENMYAESINAWHGEAARKVKV